MNSSQQKSDALIHAYNRDDIGEFTRLLKAGVNPNIVYSTEKSDTLLHRACRDNKLDFVAAMLKFSKYTVDVAKENNEMPPKSALQIAKDNSIKVQPRLLGLYNSKSVDQAALEIMKLLSNYRLESKDKRERHIKREKYQGNHFARLKFNTEPGQSRSAGKKEFQEDRKFPSFTSQEEEGCTHAQLLVLEGESELLRVWLAENPLEVNAICDSDSPGNIGKKSLVELALFDNENQDPAERLKILKIILQHRPHVFYKDTPVDDLITQRMELMKPDSELYSLYSSYVVSQKTCLASALKELTQFMETLTTLQESLKDTHLKLFVNELEEAILICNLVSAGYLKGDYDAIANELNKRFNKDKESFSSYSANLIKRAYESLRICTQLNITTAGQRNTSSKATAEPRPANEDHKLLVSQFSNMVDTINRVLTRYGDTVISGGFNDYQRIEISRYLTHKRVMHFQEGDHPLRKSK